MHRSHVVTEIFRRSRRVVTLGLRAVVTLFSMCFQVVDECVCGLEGLVTERTFVRSGGHMTVADVFHQSGGSCEIESIDTLEGCSIKLVFSC